MKRSIIVASLILGGMATAACSDVERSQNSVKYGDKPASITCTSYHGVLLNTRTTGRITFDEGRITFVDAKTGGLVITEGECVVRYDK